MWGPEAADGTATLAAPPLPAYVRALDASAAHKLQLFGPWIDALRPGPGDTLVDMGCGTGVLAAALAARHPGARVLGCDADAGMLQLARQRHAGHPRLSFVHGDACGAPCGRALAWVLSSVLHELHARGGAAAVDGALAHAATALRPGGRLIVRDFVRPPQAGRALWLHHARDDIRPGCSLADLAASAPFTLRLDAVVDDPAVDARHVRYRTDRAGVHEFLFRKDCGPCWDDELPQRYGFWTAAEAQAALARAGLRLLHHETRVNRWVIEHRVAGRVALFDAEDGAPVEPPLTQLLLVAERPPR